MDTISPSQQGSWENNIYFLTTTRVFMALGLTFLIRSVYQLYQRMRPADGDTGTTVARAGEAIGIDLEALALEAVGDTTMFGSGPFNAIDETLEITVPQPTYSPQARLSSSPVSPRQLD